MKKFKKMTKKDVLKTLGIDETKIIVTPLSQRIGDVRKGIIKNTKKSKLDAVQSVLPL
jgi:hypothetical protein